MASKFPQTIANGPEIRSLTDILNALQDAGSAGRVTVREILEEVGVRSFAPTILVPALILVSPLSAFLGLPTLGAIMIFLVTAQKLAGRDHVWLPEVLKRRRVRGGALLRAIGWLRRPCAWIDRHTHRRLTVLVSRPARFVTLLTILAIAMVIPFLEMLPMATSVFAGAISLFAIGLLARDGLFTLLGYAQVALSVALVWWLVGTGAA